MWKHLLFCKKVNRQVTELNIKSENIMAMMARPSQWGAKKSVGDTQTMKFNSNQMSTGGGRGPEGTGGKIAISDKTQVSHGGRGPNHGAGHLKPKNKKTPFSKGGGKGPG